jgi:hypothetical protein
MDQTIRYDVYSITERDEKSYWAKVGVAFPNRDGSINVSLEALPVSGKLQLRRPAEDRYARASRCAAGTGRCTPWEGETLAA